MFSLIIMVGNKLCLNRFILKLDTFRRMKMTFEAQAMLLSSHLLSFWNRYSSSEFLLFLEGMEDEQIPPR